MTNEERVENILRRAIPAARKAGFEIKPGRTFRLANGVSPENRCCAVGSVLVNRIMKHALSYLHEASEVLGIHMQECLEIAYGFDLSLSENTVIGMSLWNKMGILLRRQVESGLL